MKSQSSICAVALITASCLAPSPRASSQDSIRGVERTEFVTNGGTSRFLCKGSGSWVENHTNGQQSRFKEIRRTEREIELFDADRNINVLLTSDRGYWRQDAKEPWRPWPGSEGTWVRREAGQTVAVGASAAAANRFIIPTVQAVPSVNLPEWRKLSPK